MAENDRTQTAHIGTTRLGDGTWQFLLWAPNARSASIHLKDKDKDEFVPMDALEHGYHRAVMNSLPQNARYVYRLEDGRELPDPASRFQPEGVHGPSQIVDTAAFS